MNLFPAHDNRFRRIVHRGKKDILLVDYSGLKEVEMIDLTNRHKDVVVAEKKSSYLIANYKAMYATPDYMKVAYEFTKATNFYLLKVAFLSIKGSRVAWLKGVIYFLRVNFRSFENEEDALKFVTS
jgi:hypothetical protein